MGPISAICSLRRRLGESSAEVVALWEVVKAHHSIELDARRSRKRMRLAEERVSIVREAISSLRWDDEISEAAAEKLDKLLAFDFREQG